MTARPAEHREPSVIGRKTFPLEALPEWLGVYVADVAAALQAPVDMPAAFALGAVSIAAARVGDINPWGDHVEPLNLFVALIAPPGAKKSACVSRFMQPISAFERDLVRRTEPARRAALLEFERLEQQVERAKREEEWALAAELTEQLAETPPPIEPQLTTADVTAQKLASLLAQHRTMAIVSAEPSIIPTMLGRWAGGKSSTELDVFLQGHAGDTIRVDRLGRASEFVESPRLSLAIALQPTALEGLAGAETAGRGLLGRFLYVTAPDTRGTAKLALAKKIPDQHQADFVAGIRAMLEIEPIEKPLTLAAKAAARWEQFCDDFELRLAPGGDMRDLHGWGEKFRGAVARIAGGLHLAEGEGGRVVALDTLERAILIGGWLEAHALAAFAAMNLRPDVRDANAILEVARRDELAWVSKRTLHQHLKDRNGFKKSNALNRGLDLLVTSGWFTPKTMESGGRPSPGFDVHPKVHSEGFEGLSGGLK